MPRVPTQGELQPGAGATFGAEPSASFPVDPGEGLRALGGILQQGGQRLMRVESALERQQREQDEQIHELTMRADAKRGDNQFATQLQAELNDPKTGYLNTLGKDAVGQRRDDTFQRIGDAAKSIEQSLPRDARGLYREAVQERIRRAWEQADAHEARQSRVYLAGESEARAKAFVDDAAGAADAEDFGRLKRLALEEIDAAATAQGLPADSAQRAEMRQKLTTTLHAEIVDRLITDGRPDDAKTWLDSIDRSEVDGKVMSKLQATVRHAAIGDRSTRLSMDVVQQAPKRAQEARSAVTVDVAGVPIEITTWQEQLRRAGKAEAEPPADTRPPSLFEQEAAARDLVDQRFARGEIGAELRDATMDRLAEHYRFQRQQDAAAEAQLRTRAENWLIQNPHASVSALPGADYLEVKRRGMLGDLNAFADSGRRYTTDPAALGAVVSATDQQLRSVTAQELFNSLRGRLNDSDLRMAMAAHARANKPDDKLTKILTPLDRVKERAKQLEIIPRGRATWTKAEDERFANFLSEVQNRLTGLGHEASGDEVERVIDDVAVDQARTNVWGRDPSRPVAALTSEEQRDAYVVVGGQELKLADLDRRVETALRERIRTRNASAREAGRSGIPETHEEVMRAWAKLGQPKNVAELRLALEREEFGPRKK